ncbi:MAG: hypothetical protein AAF530_07340 [Pseudomonadota bacterium]
MRNEFGHHNNYGTAPAIWVTTAIRRAPSLCEAFEGGLKAAGLANPITIPSIARIPAGSQVIVNRLDRNHFDNDVSVPGHFAAGMTGQAHREAAAGVGWVLSADENPWGFMVARGGSSYEEVEVKIRAELHHLVRHHEAVCWAPPAFEILQVKCSGDPVAVIAAGIYQYPQARSQVFGLSA